MRKIKIMSMFFTMLIAMTGCSIQVSFDGKNELPAETEPETTELTTETTEITIETETEPETEIKITEATTEAIPETQAETELIVIAEPVAMTESVEEFGFTDYGASNLVNSGICCTDGQNYYYCDTNTKKLYQKTDGNFTVLSDNFYGYYLNLAQNIIYYADTTSDNFVTAYAVQSGQKQVICGKHASELTLYQDKLYFSTTEGNRKIIYRVNTDGTELEQLSGCEDLWYMTIYKE